MKNYGWNLNDPPDYDLCTKRRSGYYDVTHSMFDGWRVRTPQGCWAHDGTNWHLGSDVAPPQGKPNGVTREEARLFAEKLIDQIEG